MHHTLGKLRVGLGTKWTVVFEDPDDERWIVVSDGYKEPTYGVSHACLIDTVGYAGDDTRCAFCGAYPPEALEGFITMMNWDK
jgi:hypothetical protein